MLKASAGAGLAALVPGLGCGTGDTEVFAGALTDLPPEPTTAPVVADDLAAAPTPTEPPAVIEPTPGSTSTPEPTATTIPTPEPTMAVDGEMVISFTYTQGVGGKNERPYVAVWIEDAAGELAETVALWYQQQRRGERWLDHLTRWWDVDQARINGGGVDDSTTISSATREAGSYAVVWDGRIDGVDAPPADYFVCIEAAREEGPYSLIRVPLALTGRLAETALPGDGELSAASVRIDV